MPEMVKLLLERANWLPDRGVAPLQCRGGVRAILPFRMHRSDRRPVEPVSEDDELGQALEEMVAQGSVRVRDARKPWDCAPPGLSARTVST